MVTSQLPRMRPKIENQPRRKCAQRQRHTGYDPARDQDRRPCIGRHVQAGIGQLDGERQHGPDDQGGGRRQIGAQPFAGNERGAGGEIGDRADQEQDASPPAALRRECAAAGPPRLSRPRCRGRTARPPRRGCACRQGQRRRRARSRATRAPAPESRPRSSGRADFLSPPAAARWRQARVRPSPIKAGPLHLCAAANAARARQTARSAGTRK